MKRYKFLLLEKTFNIDKDVDFIYDEIFKPYIKQLENKTFKLELNKNYPLLSAKGLVLKSLGSELLKEQDSIIANEINPIYIIGGILDIDSTIVFNRKIENRNFIVISIDKDLIDIYIKNNFSFKNLTSTIDDKIIQLIVKSLKESYIKAMIYHELSHWLNNTLHNDHIVKVIKLAMKYNNPELLKLKTKNVNLTHFEIDAQIHAIKQYKRDNEKIWNKLTLFQLFNLYPSLMELYEEIKGYGETVKDIWLQTLVKRMNRENLLGKNMKIPFLDSFEIY